MKVGLFDGYNLLYRAAFSGPSWQRDKYDLEDRSVVYHFFRSIRALVRDLGLDEAVFVLEGKPVRRLDALPSYKGTRERSPDPGMGVQTRLIVDMLKHSLPFRVTRHPQLECDDLIANLARYEYPDDDIVIISSDTDFLQLSSNRIEIYNPIRKRVVTPPVNSESYVRYKALIGDNSDNIEGFRNIGNKRSAGFINNPDKLEKFLAAESGRREKLKLNESLISFHDLPNILSEIEDYRGTLDPQAVKSSFTEWGFVSIIKEDKWKDWIAVFEKIEKE